MKVNELHLLSLLEGKGTSFFLKQGHNLNVDIYLGADARDRI
jgi:hypothetical protein